MEQIQFSKDQQYLRYYTKPSTGGLSGKWVAMSLKDGKYIFSKKEQEKIEWSPIEKPKEIPPFLTQPVPKIHSQTQIQWSPNSKSLYVLDETGIWRSDIDKPFICQWIEIVKTPSILQFQLSPKGTHLLYEVMSIDEEEREIWISNVDSTSSHQIAKGWSAIFSHDGRFVFYGNLSGFYQFDLDSMRARKLRPATYRP